jgi:hypothetical protein
VHVRHVEIEDNQVDGANGEPFDRLEARRRVDEIERTRHERERRPDHAADCR